MIYDGNSELRTFSQWIMLISSPEPDKADEEITNISYRHLYTIVRENEIKVSQKSFYNYCNGISVPPYDKAKRILEVLGVSISPESVSNMLEYSKYELNFNSNESLDEEKKNENDVIRTSLALKVSNLCREDMSTGEIKNLIDERVKQTSNSFNDYVSRLIREDLYRGVLEIIKRKDKRKS